MHNITFVSTVHKEIGKCNADELCEILGIVTPDVIFLEALEDTYSEYQQNLYSNFGVYHEKLEIRAIQKYSCAYQFDYVPVLDKGLSSSFDQKFNLVCQNVQFRDILEQYNSMAGRIGFDFLNSKEGMELNMNMHEFGNSLINDKELIKVFDYDIDEYENSMLRNIYEYCENYKFENSIFMCGNAHRYSIIKKLEKIEDKGITDVNWNIYGT